MLPNNAASAQASKAQTCKTKPAKRLRTSSTEADDEVFKTCYNYIAKEILANVQAQAALNPKGSTTWTTDVLDVCKDAQIAAELAAVANTGRRLTKTKAKAS